MPGFALLALVTGLQALPPGWHATLRYDRLAVADGELWRLLTGNLIHLGWMHLLLNGCGLLIMTWLFGEERRPLQWLVDLLICSLAVNLGLFYLTPEIFWVVGLSGVLHGLFVVGAVTWVITGIGLGKWLLAGITVKLTWEQVFGEIPLSADIVGGGVVVDAHLWGALGGLVALGVGWGWSRVAGRL